MSNLGKCKVASIVFCKSMGCVGLVRLSFTDKRTFFVSLATFYVPLSIEKLLYETIYHYLKLQC